jgi:iron complex outermembrane receptor protein
VSSLRHTEQQDRWLGSGMQLAPRLDWTLGERDTLQWQLMWQAHRSRNAGERETVPLAGPPPTTLQSAYRSRGEWELARSQWQWVHKAVSGARLELKLALQQSLSTGQSRSVGQDASGVLTVAHASAHRQEGRQWSQGGRLRVPAGEHRTWSGGWDAEQRELDEQRDLVENGVPQRTGSLGVPFAGRTQRGVVFVQHEWAPSPRWSLSTALRGEQWVFETAGPPGIERHRYTALLPLLHLRHALDDAGGEVPRAPDIGLLLPRYSLDGTYPREETNAPIAPDTAGNPALSPERARGIACPRQAGPAPHLR